MSKTKLVFLEDLDSLDYSSLGLKCGLEIHQQLNTGKLFSPRSCSIVPNENLDKSISRRLRFSLSEKGETDKAAEAEFKKQKYNIYYYNDDVASLVDLDEEPPVGPNSKALETGVQIGEMLNMKFFDAIEFMRKIIIDGSVTSGFQRTAMIGKSGYVDTSFGNVEIEGLNIEEDSCRAIQRTQEYSIFSLDRQGIPLIEITTGPDAKTPQQVYELASTLGNILRSFKTTKRGLGTIRQDLNISIQGGARIEIKGAQNLKLLEQIVDAEIRRQIILLSIRDEIQQRGVSEEDILNTPVQDLTHCFDNSQSKVIKENLSGEDSGVMGISLKGMQGILGHELHDNYRFATEVSHRNKSHYPNIKGLFHSDELPKYGIEQEEVDKVRKELALGDNDGFLLVVYEREYAKESLENIKQIIAGLIQGVPSEVRQVDSKGTRTVFLRPMPGSARMYPETDIPTIVMDSLPLEKLRETLPELYEKKIDRVSQEFSLDEKKTQEFLEHFEEKQIKDLIEVSNKKAQDLYNIVFDIPKDIKRREGVETYDFSYSLLYDLLALSNQESIDNRTIRDIFLSLYKDKLKEVSNVKEYVENKDLLVEELSDEELKQIVQEVIKENEGAPFGALMGKAMQKVGGKADGKRISSMLKSLTQ